MPRPVFPVVRLPYDQPDRVARVLDTIRREFKASRPRQAITAVPLTKTTADEFRGTDRGKVHCRLGTTMTAQMQQQTQEPSKNMVVTEQTTAAASTNTEVFVDPTVDQITVGVRECTLTPKPRPEILVTAGGAPIRNAYNLHDQQHFVPSVDGDYGNPFLIVPPVNITAEISRPPLTPRYTATS